MVRDAGMRAYVAGATVLSRGMAGAVETCPILSAASHYDPAAPNPEGEPRLLDPREKRRTTATMRLALDVAERCVAASGVSASELSAVFGSSFGDPPLLGSLLETLATPDARLSPTKFHNSVHNAALGYWTIAAGCRLGCTSIAAGDHTFGAALLRGLVESTLDERPVLVVVHDAPFDPPLAALRPVAAAFAAAVLLAPAAMKSCCRIDATLVETSTSPSAPQNAGLHPLWQTNPAARSIPLLEAIARRRAATIDVAHSGDGILRLEMTPS